MLKPSTRPRAAVRLVLWVRMHFTRSHISVSQGSHSCHAKSCRKVFSWLDVDRAGMHMYDPPHCLHLDRVGSCALFRPYAVALYTPSGTSTCHVVSALTSTCQVYSVSFAEMFLTESAGCYCDWGTLELQSFPNGRRYTINSYSKQAKGVLWFALFLPSSS